MSSDLSWRSKHVEETASIRIDDTNMKHRKIHHKYPGQSVIATIGFLSVFILCVILPIVVLVDTQELSGKETLLFIITVLADFTIAVTIFAAILAIYFICSRRTDTKFTNPMVMQLNLYLILCAMIHVISAWHGTYTILLTMTKIICALVSVTTVISIYFFIDVFLKFPSIKEFRNLARELKEMKKKFHLLDSSTICHRLQQADSRTEISCIFVKELAKIAPCDILGTYQSTINERTGLHEGNDNVPMPKLAPSILTVSSSSEQFRLPQNIPFEELNDFQGIIILRVRGNRLIASILHVDNLYDFDNRFTIPVKLESELYNLRFNYYIIISCYDHTNIDARSDILMCFAEPLQLDEERITLLRQCATLAQLSYSRFQQTKFLSNQAKEYENENLCLKKNNKTLTKQLYQKVNFFKQMTQDIQQEIQTSQNLFQSHDAEELLPIVSNKLSGLMSLVTEIVEFSCSEPYPTCVSCDIWDLPLQLKTILNQIIDKNPARSQTPIHITTIPADVPRFVIGDRKPFIRCITAISQFLRDVIEKGSVFITTSCASLNVDTPFSVETAGEKIRCVANAMVQLNFVGSSFAALPFELDKSFDPLFKQGNVHYGLALANLRRLIHHSGGKIRLETSGNTEARFQVLLPFVVVDITSNSRSVILPPIEQLACLSGNSESVVPLSETIDTKGTQHKNAPHITNNGKLVSISRVNSQPLLEDVALVQTKQNIVKRVGTELRILIAEDNLLNQKVLVRLLKKLGQTDIKIVSQGDLAVAAVKNSMLEQPIDLVFMDLHMPVMGGIESCRLIRELGNGNYPHIIACTANAQNDVKEQFEALGVNSFLPKPINFDLLTSFLKYFSSNENLLSSAS